MGEYLGGIATLCDTTGSTLAAMNLGLGDYLVLGTMVVAMLSPFIWQLRKVDERVLDLERHKADKAQYIGDVLRMDERQQEMRIAQARIESKLDAQISSNMVMNDLADTVRELSENMKELIQYKNKDQCNAE